MGTWYRHMAGRKCYARGRKACTAGLLTIANVGAMKSTLGTSTGICKDLNTPDPCDVQVPRKDHKSLKKMCNLLHASFDQMFSNEDVLQSIFSLEKVENSCNQASCTLDGTWDQMMVWICWSFVALQHGYHPTHDRDGKPLKKDSPFKTINCSANH